MTWLVGGIVRNKIHCVICGSNEHYSEQNACKSTILALIGKHHYAKIDHINGIEQYENGFVFEEINNSTIDLPQREIFREIQEIL